jgi:hypothetical protein
MMEASQYPLSNYTYRDMTIKTAQNIQDDQRISIEDPYINPCLHSHLISTKGPKHMMDKKHPLQQMLLGKVHIHM